MDNATKLHTDQKCSSISVMPLLIRTALLTRSCAVVDRMMGTKKNRVLKNQNKKEQLVNNS
jgi:hypothetical protein